MDPSVLTVVYIGSDPTKADGYLAMSFKAYSGTRKALLVKLPLGYSNK